MADLEATDVTITFNPEDRDGSPQGRWRTYPSITYGGAGKTYPAGGIPLPAKANFGVPLSDIKRFYIQQPVDGYLYKYDPTNHKLLIYYGNYDASDGPLIEFVGAPGATTILLEILGR